jgi:hypothetical protein
MHPPRTVLLISHPAGAIFAGLCLAASFTLAADKPVVTYADSTRPDTSADGGLRLAVGVQNIQVYRTNRTVPTHLDRLADTYLHQPMLAWWRGRFYLEYLSGPRDESQAPCSDSLTTSPDGVHWAPPRTVFPSIKLPDGTDSIMHQRMGFYVAPDGRLLVLGYHGKAPAPNDGTGVGRVVREIHEDGSFGPIYFIRYSTHNPWNDRGPNPTYPLYKSSPDTAFVAACDALLANKLFTAQWWEEDELTEDGFFTIHGKALSFVHRPDGSVLGIWKNALTAATTDNGRTWSRQLQAANMPNNASKYWLQHTGDGRYALFLNPTDRLRYPLAVMTSDDCANFSGLLTVHGELPDQRFPGRFKNIGPQYTRGIVEGNGTPPDSATTTWITYSVNKEDIWVSRVPVPIRNRVEAPVNDNFDTAPAGSLPDGWNIYSPAWAPVRVVEIKDAGLPAEAAAKAGRALELRDEDPYDYARAIRIFPETHGVKLSFKVLAKQANARLEIELLDAHGARPVRLAFEEDGHLWACHEGVWNDAGAYAAGHWTAFELEIPRQATADRVDVRVDGKSPLSRAAVFTEPVTSVERLSFRTGAFRRTGFAGKDLPGADVKVPAAVFLVDDVVITPMK